MEISSLTALTLQTGRKTRTDPECSDGTPSLEPPVLDLCTKKNYQKMRKNMLIGGPQSPLPCRGKIWLYLQRLNLFLLKSRCNILFKRKIEERALQSTCQHIFAHSLIKYFFVSPTQEALGGEGGGYQLNILGLSQFSSRHCILEALL